MFSLLSAVSRNSSRRTRRAPVTLRCVLVSPLDIGCRAFDPAGVETCRRLDVRRGICLWVVADGGTSVRMTSGALSVRESEALGRGLGEGLGLYITAPFSILKFSFGSGRSSSSDGVGEGAYASGLRVPSFSDSYGEGGVEVDNMFEYMLNSEREQSDSEDKGDGGGGEREMRSLSKSNVEHEPHEADTVSRDSRRCPARRARRRVGYHLSRSVHCA